MAIDVQSYRADSVRILKEGSAILIECLERIKDRAATLAQTGVFARDGTVQNDPTPNLGSLPALSSCNYAYHRVALPDNFAKGGLKYGYDDVSGHVVITGKLLSADGGNKVKNTSKGPAVCNILWREKARGPPTYHELWDMAHKKFADEHMQQKGLGGRKVPVPKFTQLTKTKSRLEIEGAIMRNLIPSKSEVNKVKRSSSAAVYPKPKVKSSTARQSRA